MFDAHTQELLERYRFDPARFEAQRKQLQAHPFSADAARVKGPLKPLPSEAFVTVDERHRALGEAAIARGEVAFLLLNGGMATRFGGIAKGAANALGDRSFLALRMEQARKAGQGRVPVVLMNSFATDTATAAHLAAHAFFGFAREDVLTCLQGISVRLTEHGDVFRDDAGAPSLYAPGHGDLPWSLAVSGVASILRARGVKTIMVSNVDNLGSTLDATVLGAHLANGAPLSVETVKPIAGDVGGAPVEVDGKLQLIEGFRYPPGFDTAVLTGFNINTMYFSWSALDPDVQLGFYAVAKKVDGRSAIQFERIIGEITAHVPTAYMHVSRDDTHGRFLPVKAPEDLIRLQPVLRSRYG